MTQDVAQLQARISELEQELARRPSERRPLSYGTQELTGVHKDPLLVSWHGESKAMIVSTMDRYFTHTVATAISLWDLLVEFHDHPDEVYKRETGVDRRWKPKSAPSSAEQDAWITEHGDQTPSLDDLDLEI